MKRTASFVSTVAVGMSLVVAACTGGASPTPAPTATPAPTEGATSTASPTAAPVVPTSLITAGTVVDCVDIEYPPMEFFQTAGETDANKAVGFDVDSARAVVKRWGLTLDVHNTSFDTLIPDLQAGRCDIVWTALYVNAKRLQVVEAVPYLASGHVIMVPAGNPKNIKTLDDLCGKTVSIQKGGLVEQLINDQSKKCTDAGKPAIDIQGYPTVAEEFQQIVIGRVDAVWETDVSVLNFQFSNPGKYDVAVANPKTTSFGVYFQKGKADIAAALVDALKALKADGTLAAVATQYKLEPAGLDAPCPTGTETTGCHPVQ